MVLNGTIVDGMSLNGGDARSVVVKVCPRHLSGFAAYATYAPHASRAAHAGAQYFLMPRCQKFAIGVSNSFELSCRRVTAVMAA